MPLLRVLSYLVVELDELEYSADSLIDGILENDVWAANLEIN